LNRQALAAVAQIVLKVRAARDRKRRVTEGVKDASRSAPGLPRRKLSTGSAPYAASRRVDRA